MLPVVPALGLLVVCDRVAPVRRYRRQLRAPRPIDDFTTFFRVLFLATLVVIVGSHEYVEKHVSHVGEFYALLLFSTVGAMLMARARDLLTAYLAIELLSFSLYILVSLRQERHAAPVRRR